MDEPDMSEHPMAEPRNFDSHVSDARITESTAIVPGSSRTTQASPEQQVVIDSWGQGMAVLAGAGSGKTTTLVAKCARLSELNPQARFVAVSFTERSASDLRAKLSQALLKTAEPGALYQHWITTIHGLCGSIIREFPRQAGFDGEESVLSDSEAQILWNRAIDALWLEDLPEPITPALESLLNRESRDALADLLKRLRELFSFGVLEALQTLTDPHSIALEKVGRYVLDRYERLKNRQGSMDFNDLERGADRALSVLEVREAYHKRFELVLVDEFQDTNPIQARIIWKLARPDVSNLCVVGDPKQSIYRFRDADVSVFEEYCARLPIRQSLTWNFRSLPGIIGFANQLCEKSFAASEMNFDALIPKRQAPEGQETVLRLDTTHPNELADWIQSEVKRGVALHDMALLVRKIRGNEKWLKALTSAGIPLMIGSGGLFWEEPRIRELVAFLKWWDNPGHTLSGATFLRAPWMGISDPDLDDWLKKDPTLKAPFFNSTHPIADKLRPFLNAVVRPGELLLSLLLNQELEDELGAPLLGLWHRVEDFSSRGMDFHAVVMELTTAVQKSRREREVPAPKNLGQLSVLTLHGSKGLEFPHVILIDLGDKTRSSDTPLLFWDRKEGVFLASRDANGEREKTNTQESNWREMEKKKSLAESKRLFYVALTRARERLILVCPELRESKKNDEETDFVAEEVFKQDYWRGWVECSGVDLPHAVVPEKVLAARTVASFEERDFVAQLSFDLFADRPTLADPVAPHLTPVTSPLLTRARHSVTEWTLLSRCPRAYEWTFIRPRKVVEAQAEEPDASEGSATGAHYASGFTSNFDPDAAVFEESPALLPNPVSHRELGTRVHAYLEKGDFLGLKELQNEVGDARFLAEPLMKWAHCTPFMAPAQTEAGRFVWTELPFEVPLDNEVVVGSIDRLVEENVGGSKRYSIIDFKMTEKLKSIGSLLDAYQTQMELYAWALTVLEPRASLDSIRAVIVNISASSIQPVTVPLGRINLKKLSESALQIINGAPGKPDPGSLCRYCQFLNQCPEGASL
jgi:ATP-dependent exoDNAse (exonuclease V) beta subunit